MRGGNTVPNMATVTAHKVGAPPGWAMLERKLFDLIDEAAPVMVRTHTERGGALVWADDLDDLYERVFNWGLYYSLGGGEHVLDLALEVWNASTRITDASIVHRRHPRWTQGSHREYYNNSQPSEWHHQGEGNMAFYHFGLADPTISENVRRSRAFAAMLMGDDPQAPNYDKAHRVFRSPFQTSQGPKLHATREQVMGFLHGSYLLQQPEMLAQWQPAPMGVRATLYPVVKDLPLGWWDDPARAREVVKLFDKMVMNADTPNSLGATALVTNAYMYTGDDRYRQWVLDYVDGWMDRMEKNGGIMPDNVGPTGKIGENREGQWWGGFYGWDHKINWKAKGMAVMFHGIATGAECALLLTGDYGYLDMLRNQLTTQLDNSKKREDGQLLVPWRYGVNGWDDHDPMRMKEPAHVWAASLAPRDAELMRTIMDGERERDWTQVISEGDKGFGRNEPARFLYYEGKKDDWPEQALMRDYELSIAYYDHARNETRSKLEIAADNVYPANPVTTRALMQLTMGGAQYLYNGGLVMAAVRYFDPERSRPGLPPDVAALVDELTADTVGIHLVNTSPSESRTVIVQAGGFGEHRFTTLRYLDVKGDERIQPVHGVYFSMQLPPATAMRVLVNRERFVNRPSYRFPWHGDSIPVPFQ